MIIMIEFRIVSQNDEYEQAQALVSRVYEREGYTGNVKIGDSGIGHFLRSGGSTTLFAQSGDQVLGTISLVSDAETGLPMDNIYREELDIFRREKKKILEVCQFAVDKIALKNMMSEEIEKTPEHEISLSLLGYALQYGIHKGYDYLCFTINPKHVPFYESLGCIKIGDEKLYPFVNNAPAVAYALPVKEVLKQETSSYKQNFLHKKMMSIPVRHDFLNVGN